MDDYDLFENFIKRKFNTINFNSHTEYEQMNVCVETYIKKEDYANLVNLILLYLQNEVTNIIHDIVFKYSNNKYFNNLCLNFLENSYVKENLLPDVSILNMK